MSFWLIKSEPDSWSWDNHVQKGVEHWDGIRNYQAANNMKAMRIGDLAFFYHSNTGKDIVGVVEVVKEYYPDHTDPKGQFGMVDFKALKPLSPSVTLTEIKQHPQLQDMTLIKQARLSVSPVKKQEWDIILGMSAQKIVNTK